MKLDLPVIDLLLTALYNLPKQQQKGVVYDRAVSMLETSRKAIEIKIQRKENENNGNRSDRKR